MLQRIRDPRPCMISSMNTATGGGAGRGRQSSGCRRWPSSLEGGEEEVSQASATPKAGAGVEGRGCHAGLSGCHSSSPLLSREAGRARQGAPGSPPRLEHCGPGGCAFGELWQMGFSLEEGLLEPAGCLPTRSGCRAPSGQDRAPCSPAWWLYLGNRLHKPLS